jgi:hypothetical protein
MKYIITENRLNQIMKRFLDSYLLGKNVMDNQGGIAVYDNDDDEDYLQYFPRKGELFISDSFLEEFEFMFGLTRKESFRFIVDWFENEFHVKVRMVE